MPSLRLPAALVALCLLTAGPAAAQTAGTYPFDETKIFKTELGYKELVASLDAAIKANKMGVVARASATVGAKSIGVTIPGNMVVMVFRPDFAVRMLKASVPAGFEAPIRFYITEGSDGKATLAYRTPSSVFAPYKSNTLDKMAKELDVIFARIAAAAIKGK